MKSFKKTLFTILSVVMVLSSTASAYASVQTDISKEINTEKKTVIYNTMTEAQREAERNRQVQEHINQLKLNSGENIVLRNDPDDYKHEWGTSKTITAEGFAGNQSAWTRFKTGGGFWYSNGGGPSVSVSASFPKPFGFFSISCNLGVSGSSGEYIEAPNKTDYFKLYIKKYYEATPYIVYKKVWDEFEGEKWVEFSRGCTKIWDRTDTEAKARP